MRSERWRQVDEVFGEALDRTAGERAAWLDEACGGDGDLRQKVERLLAAEEQARSFLERPLGETDVSGNEVAGAHGGHPKLAQVHYNWAFVLHRNGELARAEEHYRRALDWIAANQQLAHPGFAYVKAGYGRLLTDLGRPAEAEPLLRQAVASLRATHSAGHVRVAAAENDLGACLLHQGRHDEAEPLLLRSQEALAAWPEESDDKVVRARQRLAELYRARGEAERAVALEAELALPGS